MLNIGWGDNLLNGLPNLHELGGARTRVRLEPAPLGPVVGLVMMIHVAKQQATLAFVDNKSEVGADTYRPEILVLRLVEFVKLHARVGRVQLQVEGRRLDEL